MTQSRWKSVELFSTLGLRLCTLAWSKTRVSWGNNGYPPRIPPQGAGAGEWNIFLVLSRDSNTQCPPPSVWDDVDAFCFPSSSGQPKIECRYRQSFRMIEGSIAMTSLKIQFANSGSDVTTVVRMGHTGWSVHRWLDSLLLPPLSDIITCYCGGSYMNREKLDVLCILATNVAQAALANVLNRHTWNSEI